MGENLANKILNEHLVSYDEKSNMMQIKMERTLTQDATGTLAYLEFMQMGKDKVETELSVSYVDHNTLQNGFMNADDHRFLQTVANKYGIVFSKPGNGIQTENDTSSADVIISIKTGETIITTVVISIISLLSIICGAYIIKKKVL